MLNTNNFCKYTQHSRIIKKNKKDSKISGLLNPVKIQIEEMESLYAMALMISNLGLKADKGMPMEN